jgi:sugar O-acyltransferase (sialic acid O-acetyltransferase NeuD family)
VILSMNNTDNQPVIILGGGGHASMLAEICIEQGRQILAVVSPEPILPRKIFQGIRHLTNDDEVSEFSASNVELVNGVGGLPGSDLRKQLATQFSELGYRFATLVAPSATVSQTVALGEGVQVLPRATVNVGASIGMHTILNSGALVEHDCIIDSFVHIAPGATICGGTTIREMAQIGPNSVVAQGLNIGEYSIIGAGVSVVRSVESYTKVLPAKTATSIWKKV